MNPCPRPAWPLSTIQTSTHLHPLTNSHMNLFPGLAWHLSTPLTIVNWRPCSSSTLPLVSLVVALVLVEVAVGTVARMVWTGKARGVVTDRVSAQCVVYPWPWLWLWKVTSDLPLCNWSTGRCARFPLRTMVLSFIICSNCF